MNSAFNEMLNSIRMQLTEADEIDLYGLDKPHQQYVSAIERVGRNCKFERAWEGVHGVILDFEVKSMGGGGASFRMPKDMVEVINGFSSFRWMELGKDSLTVGC
jgi:hypothetical protein